VCVCARVAQTARTRERDGHSSDGSAVKPAVFTWVSVHNARRWLKSNALEKLGNKSGSIGRLTLGPFVAPRE
jgi:hypothetical protein